MFNKQASCTGDPYQTTSKPEKVLAKCPSGKEIKKRRRHVTRTWSLEVSYAFLSQVKSAADASKEAKIEMTSHEAWPIGKETRLNSCSLALLTFKCMIESDLRH